MKNHLFITLLACAMLSVTPAMRATVHNQAAFITQLGQENILYPSQHDDLPDNIAATAGRVVPPIEQTKRLQALQNGIEEHLKSKPNIDGKAKSKLTETKKVVARHKAKLEMLLNKVANTTRLQQQYSNQLEDESTRATTEVKESLTQTSNALFASEPRIVKKQAVRVEVEKKAPVSKKKKAVAKSNQTKTGKKQTKKSNTIKEAKEQKMQYSSKK
jgi:hypothetical protein